MLAWFEHSQIYHPDKMFPATGAELGRPFDDVYFQASDGVRLNGWFFPAAASAERALPAFLFCHGNGGNISHRLDTYRALLGLGLNVLAFDYRGYGRSEGQPTEEGTYRDAQAAYSWLRTRGFSGGDIIAFGESLGGGVAAELAARESLGGLVLLSTFTSMPDIGAEVFPWLPVRWLARIRYETCSKLPRLKIPLLVMHSRGDELIGFHHGEKNFSVANEPKLFWEISGAHNNPLADREQFLAGLKEFLKHIERARSQEAGANSN